MLKIAIIGYGKMGRIRHQLIEQLPDAQVVAVSDVEKPEECALPFHENHQDIIDDPQIDAIIICSPNYTIRDLVISALQNGKHVFAEKPPGVSLQQVDEMKEASAKFPHLKLKFGFNHRYHQTVMLAKEKISSGNYGEILWMRGRYGKSVDEDYQHSWRAKKELAGGGILLDQGIHMLDLMLHFVDDFDEVKAFCQKQYWGLDIEDNVFAMFRNKKGQTASMHSTMTQWRNLFSLEIFLERGYMVLNGLLTSSKSYTTKRGEENLTISLNRSPAPAAKHDSEERHSFDEDFSFEKEMSEFVECIRDNSDIRVGTINDAEKIMTLVEKIYADDAVGLQG
jgi:1,5-anhydro-D-fructose reductase (1,5-anhydro-D-mannitol-forming)